VLAVLYLDLLAGRLGRSPARDFLTHGVFGRFPQFAAGIAAAWLYRRRQAYGPRGPSLGPGASDLALLVCLAVLALLLRPVVHGGYYAWNQPPGFAWHVPEGICWAAVLLIVLHGRPVVRPVLVNAPLARLGVLSYSIYLLHMPVLWYSLTTARPIFGLPGAWSVGNVVWLVAALAATVAASAVTYRLIEQPFLRRKARLVAPGSRESGP
jgi:peptidoglycan/LPS O-acetylase OafA/YrhL